MTKISWRPRSAPLAKHEEFVSVVGAGSLVAAEVHRHRSDPLDSAISSRPLRIVIYDLISRSERGAPYRSTSGFQVGVCRSTFPPMDRLRYWRVPISGATAHDLPPSTSQSIREKSCRGLAGGPGFRPRCHQQHSETHPSRTLRTVGVGDV